MKQSIPYVSPRTDSFQIEQGGVVCGSLYSAKYGGSGQSGIFDQDDIYDGGSF